MGAQGVAPQTNALIVRVKKHPPWSTDEETGDERDEGLAQGHRAELRLEPRVPTTQINPLPITSTTTIYLQVLINLSLLEVSDLSDGIWIASVSFIYISIMEANESVLQDVLVLLVAQN